MLKAVLLLAVCCLLVCAQETTPPAAQEATPAAAEAAKKATIEGVVVNEITKEPIRRVEVTLYGGGRDGNPYSGVTDAAGKFKIESIDAGDYRVGIRKGGFLIGRASYGMSARSLKLTAGASLTGLRYSLLPQAIITGRVVDDEGEPLQGISVMLLQNRWYRGSFRLSSMSRPQQTNDRGEFRITDVQPGKYYLMADVRRMGPMGGGAPVEPAAAKDAPRTAFVATFFPNAPEPAQAARIEVQAGQELSGRDISLRKERVVRVSGKVLDTSGAPAKDASVSLSLADSGNAASFMGGVGNVNMMVDEKGVFSSDKVPPGQYKAQATHFVGDTSEQSAQIPVSVGDSGVQGLVLQVQPALEAKGVFVLEGSGKKDFDFAGLRVMLRPAVELAYFSAEGQAKQDGTFELNGFGAGRYTVTAYVGPNDAYIKSILVGDEEVYGKEVDGAAVAAAGLKIVIRLDGATLSGTVEIPEDRKAGLKSPSVVLLPSDGRLLEFGARNFTQLNQNNGYELKNLRPGDYIAFAFEEYDYQSLQDPEVFAAIASKGTKVSLSAKESKSLDLKLLQWPEKFADRLQ